MEKNKSTGTLIKICEAAIIIALSLILSYLKLKLWFSGGSVDIVMIPLIVFALRRGRLWGVGAGFVFGILKYFLAGGFAIVWSSILLDYAVAYGVVGLAGCFRRGSSAMLKGTLVGCVSRFVIHFISGVTIYAITTPTEIFSMTIASPWLFSLVYNGTYMLPNTIIAAIIAVLAEKPLRKAKVLI